MTNLWVLAIIAGPTLLYLTKLFYRAERPAPSSTPGVNLSAALAGVLALLLPVVLGLGAVILAEAVTVTMLAKGRADTARCWIYVRRRRRCSTTPATVGASIPRRIWRGMPASCRPTPMAGTTSSIWRDTTLDRSGSGVLGPCAALILAMADIEENARRNASGKKEIPLSPIAAEVVRRIHTY
jgi:transposase